MKEKKLTITSNDITQKQWSNLILELKLNYVKLGLHMQR